MLRIVARDGRPTVTTALAGPHIRMALNVVHRRPRHVHSVSRVGCGDL